MTKAVDIVSDVVCPWCYIGVTRLERALAEGGHDDVRVTYHPFQLDPTTPAGGRDLAAWLQARYRRDPAPMFRAVEAEAARGGHTLDLSRQPRVYPTLPAHVLLEAARDGGQQRALARALFAAYFDEGRDISDPAVLGAIGQRFGLPHADVERHVNDPAALEAAAESARDMARQGIGGVPFFVFSGAGEPFAVSGAQPLDAFRQLVAQAFGGAAR